MIANSENNKQIEIIKN